MKNSFIERYRGDYEFRTFAGAWLSFGITALFAIYNGYLGIAQSSLWHGSIAGYYIILAVIRKIILLSDRKIRRMESGKNEARMKTFRISSAFLMLLNIALICPIALMVMFEKPVNIGMIPAIAMAAYTTYKIVMASVNFGSKKKKLSGNILISELRAISLIDAIVSVMSLQNTLIMVNGGAESMLTLSAITSGAMYAILLIISVRLLIESGKRNPCR
ncbi:MAG: hypothetical protein LUC38_07315 [Oscillospiraceae bacterium]|nr:hypothetical protein [Ruminococcus sp.]MCD8345752.1 hypothetical protein [Oscillospiraceae bacterium]